MKTGRQMWKRADKCENGQKICRNGLTHICGIKQKKGNGPEKCQTVRKNVETGRKYFESRKLKLENFEEKIGKLNLK